MIRLTPIITISLLLPAFRLAVEDVRQNGDDAKLVSAASLVDGGLAGNLDEFGRRQVGLELVEGKVDDVGGGSAALEVLSVGRGLDAAGEPLDGRITADAVFPGLDRLFRRVQGAQFHFALELRRRVGPSGSEILAMAAPESRCDGIGRGGSSMGRGV